MRQLLRCAAVVGLLLAGAPAQPALASAPEDDLQVVKRAVQDRPAPNPARDATPVLAGNEKPAPRAPGGASQWLRIRVDKRDGKRVRIRLPLGLVRALDDWPIEIGCHRRGDRDERRCSKLRLGEVLAALDKGESLVEIDDDGTSVRVWIE